MKRYGLLISYSKLQRKSIMFLLILSPPIIFVKALRHLFLFFIFATIIMGKYFNSIINNNKGRPGVIPEAAFSVFLQPRPVYFTEARNSFILTVRPSRTDW